MQTRQLLNIQGHRGARGLYPENTLTGFKEAVKLGVNALEMDVVISKDLQVVVSHEAWMNPDFCSLPNGNPVEINTIEKCNLFKMPYSEIRKYDCGKRGNAAFPQQKPLPEHKPLLSEVIAGVEDYVKENKLQKVKYTIEIKSEPEEDGVFNPPPTLFVDLVYKEIKKYNIQNQFCLQSFDVRILQEIKKKDPIVKIALLVENNDSLKTNLSRLGFKPNVYSPDYTLVNQAMILELKNQNIEIIPWTVNETEDMKNLINMHVHGLITDYPDRAIKLAKTYGIYSFQNN